MEKCLYCEEPLTPNNVRASTNGSGKPHNTCQPCHKMQGRICLISEKNEKLIEYVNNKNRQAKWAARRAERDERKARQVPPSQPLLETVKVPEPVASFDKVFVVTDERLVKMLQEMMKDA